MTMTAAIIQARMKSARLPGKVLMDLGGEPVLQRVVERVRQAKSIDTIIIATSTDPSDDIIERFCIERGISVFRGSLSDVLDRYASASSQNGCESIVRITSDCPLIDPTTIDRVVEAYQRDGYDYVSNCSNGSRTFPHGLDVEVFSAEALKRAHREARLPFEREHVTPYMWDNDESGYRIGPAVEATEEYHRPYRITLDYPEDYELIKHLYDRFADSEGIIHVPDVLRHLDAHPELVALNAFRTVDHLTWAGKI